MFVGTEGIQHTQHPIRVAIRVQKIGVERVASCVHWAVQPAAFKACPSSQCACRSRSNIRDRSYRRRASRCPSTAKAARSE
eukprot:6103288-Pleurochrysis_carterae.AAC.2